MIEFDQVWHHHGLRPTLRGLAVRRATGRWIAPGTDRLGLRTLALAAVGAVAVALIDRLPLPPAAAVPLAGSAAVFVLTLGKPSLTRWARTGPRPLAHRVAPYAPDAAATPRVREVATASESLAASPLRRTR